jgi:hypothetical protein
MVPPSGVGVFAVMPAKLQRDAVRQTHMAVEALNEDLDCPQ